MNLSRLKFAVFCCIWVALLILVFPVPDKWEIKSGALSSSAPAVHPATGVCALTPLLCVKETESPVGKNFSHHGMAGFMPEDVKLDGCPLAHTDDRRFLHDLVYGCLENRCIPLVITPGMVSPRPGWSVLGLENNKLTLLAPDGSRFCYEFSSLPQNTVVFYSGEVQEGKLTIFEYETELYNTTFALEASREALENLYRIYRSPDFHVLLRLCLLFIVFLGGLILCNRLWPFPGSAATRKG